MSRPEVEAVFSHDVVIVGAGIAGLAAALGAAPRPVALLTKTRLGEGGSSPWAQGGMAAAVGADDSPALHAADTLAVSGGIGDPEVVAVLAAEGPGVVDRLLDLGVELDRDAAGHLALGREAAHSRRRILHAHGDTTGAELVRALSAAVRRAAHVRVFEQLFAEDLVVEKGRVVGLVARRADGRRELHLARAVVLATGGIGQVYGCTTNPPEVTGDGLAMAARAGARLADLEMVQFHPTALAAGADPMPLLTEALRGEGAILVDAAGRRFMVEEHPLAELAPRDVVARAIHRRLEAGERVFLDARRAVGEAFPQRFPRVFGLCQEHGLDPRRQPMPVAPAAHYHMGGIASDLDGRTSLPGLWVCGEASSTGAHGANRLASNSLLEGAVFGSRVAGDLKRNLGPLLPAPRLHDLPPPRAAAPEVEAAVEAEVRQLMTRHVGVVREAAGLREALERFEALEAAHPALGGEARNLLLVAQLVTAAALARQESRGGHFRADFPGTDPAQARRSFWVLGADGELRAVQEEGAEPVIAAGARA
ncbi:MAG TPA: L-aspartate oxidase [Thermoanaerobaculia bacterium]|nr:L-aspartate oxidase [Thermoanaerobaculia bacterium]